MNNHIVIMIVEITAIAINIRNQNIPLLSLFLPTLLGADSLSFVPEVPVSRISHTRNLISFPTPVTKSSKAIYYSLIYTAKVEKRKS